MISVDLQPAGLLVIVIVILSLSVVRILVDVLRTPILPRTRVGRLFTGRIVLPGLDPPSADITLRVAATSDMLAVEPPHLFPEIAIMYVVDVTK